MGGIPRHCGPPMAYNELGSIPSLRRCLCDPPISGDSRSIVLAFVALVVWADTFTVPTDFATIQEAIDAAVDGDCINVEPGTYVENIDFMGKAITVQSTDGEDVTIIDGSACTVRNELLVCSRHYSYWVI